MFAKSIVLSDAFLDMPMSARCLYFTLSMFADDDGFVSSPKGIMRQCGASEDDLKVLLSKRYVLAFESGVIVIKHWRINNFLRKDRHVKTTYQEELASLTLDEKGAYVEFGQPSNGQPYIGQPSIEENSIDKNSIDVYEVSSNTKVYTEDETSVDELSEETIQLITDTWNRQEIVYKIRFKIKPLTNYYDRIRVILRDHTLKEFLEAIESLKEQDWLVKRWKERNIFVDFKWFTEPEAFNNVISGRYKTVFEEEQKPTHKNGFKNFDERERDWEDLEARLFGGGR